MLAASTKVDQCIATPRGYSVVFAEPSLRCDSSSYKGLFAYSILIDIVFLAGFPLAILALSVTFYSSHKGGASKQSSRGLFLFGCLFEPFRPGNSKSRPV